MVKLPKNRVKKTHTKKAKKKSDREIIHSKPTVELCAGTNAITCQKAKDLLGWEEETKETSYGKEFLLKDFHGTKIRCYNNMRNRPLRMPRVQELKQEILRGKWQFNGVNIIIGTTGQTVNAQHRLIALIFAVDEWHSDKEKWIKTCLQEPTITSTICFGIDESDEVINTIDTGTPRTLADVIYRSAFFAHLADKDRNKISRITDYAVKLLWERTGVTADAFALRRTHSESLDFIERHHKLIECAKHIHEENGNDKNIDFFLSSGYATALLYMMGSCMTDSEEYRITRNESIIDWSIYDKACDFFVLLAGKAKEVEPVRIVLKDMLANTTENVTPRERWSLLIKAWNSFVADEPITVEEIKLLYSVDGDGINRLIELPTIGGIDCDGEIDPTPSEIAERSQAERQKKTAKKKTSKKPKKDLSKDIILGDHVRVGIGRGSWKGEVVEILGNNTKIKVGQGYQGSGTIKVAQLPSLTRI